MLTSPNPPHHLHHLGVIPLGVNRVRNLGAGVAERKLRCIKAEVQEPGFSQPGTGNDVFPKPPPDSPRRCSCQRRQTARRLVVLSTPTWLARLIAQPATCSN